MYVFIDESADANHFLLSGVIAHTESNLNQIVKQFRSKVRSSNLSKKDINKINNDPKEHHLHNSHPRMLAAYIDLLATDNRKMRKNVSLTSAAYAKKAKEVFDGSRMMLVYEKLILKMIEEVHIHFPGEHVDLIFDTFSQAPEMKARLDDLIPQHFPNLSYSLEHADGKSRNGLFVADLVAGTSRRALLSQSPNYFHDLKHLFLPSRIVNVDVQ